MKAILTWIMAMAAMLSGFAFAAPLQTQTEQWIEIRSDNFVFQGTSKPEKAQALLLGLEAFRSQAIEKLAGEAEAEPVAIRIFALSPTPELEAALPFPGFSVLSNRDLDGPVFLINDALDWTQGHGARRTLLRDYARHLIAIYAPDQYPVWMQSGLADDLAAADINAVAVPPPFVEAYAYPLSWEKWVPMATVLGAMTEFSVVENKDDSLDTEMLQQAQSWAAVRYIFQNTSMARRVPGYLNRLDAGERPDKAFKRAFGLSAKKFERKLKREFSGRQMVVADAPRIDNEPQPAPDALTLDPAGAALAHGDALRIFAFTDQGYAETDRQYQSLASEDAAFGFALAGQAETAAARGDFATAQDFMTKATAHSPDVAALRKRAGGLYLSQFDESGEARWLTPARDHFVAALALDGEDPAANFYYAAICAHIECPADAANRAAITALSYYHDAQYIPAIANVLPVLEASGAQEVLGEFTRLADVWGPKRYAD